MEQNVAKSIVYLEFINSITSLTNNLLYSQQDGYYSWSPKDAILNFENIVKKFDSEALKLVKNVNYSDVEDVINTKKVYLIKEIQKHYDVQILLWADQVYNDFVENLLFELSIDKTKSQEIYNQLIQAINWLCEVKKISIEAHQTILNEITFKFNNVLKSNDSDYLPLNTINKSNPDEFCYLWNLILENLNEFLSEDLLQYQTKLTIEDIRYFENIKIKLQSCKKTVTLDEINLIVSAMEIAKIDVAESKYEFIKQVHFDFVAFLEQNKTITEEDKVRLIRRRIELFTDKSTKGKNYFKKLFTF